MAKLTKMALCLLRVFVYTNNIESTLLHHYVLLATLLLHKQFIFLNMKIKYLVFFCTVSHH